MTITSTSPPDLREGDFAVIDRPVDAPHFVTNAISWGAIIAGATGAAALSLILMILGVGLGLSSVSPWSCEGISAASFGLSTIVWLTLTQLLASAMGGYLAGRGARVLLLEAGVMGSFLSLDLFLFFVFFEIVLVPMYFLIGKWGYDQRIYAATKFFIYTMAGSAFMLVGIVATAFLARRDIGHLSFDLIEIAEKSNFATGTGRWLFVGFVIAFAVKVPLFPLHTWLPDAHTQAPTGGSVILAGVLLKMGTYGMLRFGVYLFPEAAVWAKPVLLTLAVIGIIYGAIAATMQKDLKRLVAYSSVAHLGFIVLGTFALTNQAITGGVMQMVNHGISTGALFLMVGMIYERRHTRVIAELKGIQAVAPIFAGFFMLIMLSSIGLPGLNGFVGEFLILIGSFPTARWWVVAATTGVILAALYLLWAYQRVFHGEPDEANKSFAEISKREAMLLSVFVAAIVFTGVYPKPMLNRIEPSVKSLLEHVESRSNYKQPEIKAGE